MKQFLLTMLLCTAATLNALAQWNPGDNNLTQIAQQSDIEFNSPTMIRKADGSTILAYRTFGHQTNPETGQKDTERQFYLYLQMLDKDGNKMWGDDGVLVSYKPTDIAMYSSPSLDTLSNGNIIVTFADIREVGNNNGDLTHTNIKPCKAIAYCYNQNGESVWSKDGVMLPYHVMDPTAWVTFYVGEKIAVSGDKIYFGSAIIEQIEVGGYDHYTHYFEVACLDYDGNILAEKHDSVWQAFTYTLAPAPDGKAYFIYVDENDHYSAQLLGPDCQNIWADTVLVDSTSVVSREGSSAVALPPSDLIKINDGSVGLVYKAFLPGRLSERFYNRLYPDGSVLKDHVLLSDSVGYDHNYVIMVEDDTLTIAQCMEYNRAEHGEYFLYLNRILLDGTRLLPNYYGLWADESTGVDMVPRCIVKADENYNVIVTTEDYYSGTYQQYSYTISPDGKMFQRKPILHNVWIDDIANYTENQYAYLCFGRDQLGQKGLWIACIDGTDYTNSEPITAEIPGKFTVSADGNQVTFSKGNLQYLPARQTYLFAAHQFQSQDILNQWISETSLDFEDLFGWGTGDHASKISTNDADYPTFNEWGKNDILNTSYDAGTWRTMTKDEWDYLLNGRENAAQKRTIGQITIGDYTPICGTFLLPDEFEMPQGLEMDMTAQDWSTNIYDPASLFMLQDAGAVFLPNDGYRVELEIKDIQPYNHRGLNGYYWTATESGATDAQMMYLTKTGPSFDARPRSQGMNVRLVKDAGAPVGIKDVAAPAKDNTIRKVLINGKFYIMQGDNLFNAQGAQLR